VKPLKPEVEDAWSRAERAQKTAESLVGEDPDDHLSVGDEVDVTVREGQIVVTPSERIRDRYPLGELLARMPENYEPAEEDWGAPVGREVW
jgi:antitoxin MazE